MTLTIAVTLGLAAGLHAAAYGAYKDSPHESFLARRFVRELVIAGLCGLLLARLHLSDGETPFIVFLSSFALARIATEFWKLFVRVEPQQDYRIPTQIHWVKGVVHNRGLRFLLGFGFLASLYGISAIATTIPADTPVALRGALAGAAVGIAEAIAGAYKDGSIEGFSPLKFLKSPVFGTLGGLVAAGHTGNPVSLVLAAIGTMRMLLELMFKMVVPGYVPGKFRSMTGPFPIWLTRRRLFLPAYAATWALYLVLATRPSLTAVPLFAAGPSLETPTAAATASCGTSIAAPMRWQYVVRGRIRPLFVWTGRHEVGAARFARNEGASGVNRRLEIVIGTDPDRAPMRLNRWGYIAETVCGTRASLLGLMTQSDEENLSDAVNIDTASGGQPFTAIRAAQSDGVVRTELFRLAPPENPTFKQVDAVLARLPAPREGRRTAVPAGVDSGFLVALTGLAHDSVVASARSGAAAGPPRRYVYDGRLYDLSAGVVRLADLTVNGRRHAAPLEGSFQIRNLTTGSTTAFRMSVGTGATDAEVPLRVVYQPRWWLELELSLDADSR